MLFNKKEFNRLINNHFPSAMFRMNISPYRRYCLHIYTSKFQGKPHKEQEQMVLDVLKKGDIGVDLDDIAISTADCLLKF